MLPDTVSHSEKAASFILSGTAHERRSKRREMGSRSMTHPPDIIQQAELDGGSAEL